MTGKLDHDSEKEKIFINHTHCDKNRQELPVDMVKTNALCMWQYSRIFSVTRVPLHHCDTLVQADSKEVRHIVVLLRDQIYKLNIYKEMKKDIWILLTTEEIER